jgi:hypothetical protein
MYAIQAWCQDPRHHAIHPLLLLATRQLAAEMTIIASNQQEGFRRFVLAIQYHGGNYLGAAASSSPEKEEILMKGRSVSGRIMDALHGN